jgi:lysyl-tRNA synthetase class 2
MRGKQDHSRERALRHNQTEAERRLWESLRNRRLGGHRFRRQHRIGPYYADFACTEAALIVELDGGQHLQQAGHDAMRTAYLERRGYRVLRFWNDDALARTDEVLDAVLAALHTPHPASLREAVPLPAPRGEGNAVCLRGEGNAVCLRGEGNALPSPRLRGEGAEGG